MFETGDNDGIDAWLRRHKGARAGLVHSLEAFRPRLIVFTLAVVLLTVAIFRYAVPVLVEVRRVGDAALRAGDDRLRRPLLARWHAARALKLPSRTRRPPYPRNFRSSPPYRKAAPAPTGWSSATAADRPQRLRLPNGQLIVTDDLIKLAEGDDVMVLGVLGHENRPCEYKHTPRRSIAWRRHALILLVPATSAPAYRTS